MTLEAAHREGCTRLEPPLKSLEQASPLVPIIREFETIFEKVSLQKERERAVQKRAHLFGVGRFAAHTLEIVLSISLWTCSIVPTVFEGSCFTFAVSKIPHGNFDTFGLRI